MSDDEQPTLAELLAKAAAALQREFAENDDFRRKLEQVAKTAQDLARDGLWPRPTPVPRLPQRLAGSAGNASQAWAWLRPLGQDPRAVTVYPEVAAATGTAPSPGIRTSFTASGSSPAEPKRGPLAGLSPSQKTALVLIWVIAYVLPLLQMALPADYQTLATNAAAWWGIALAITYAILANRK
jgi:hypothetical protein